MKKNSSTVPKQMLLFSQEDAPVSVWLRAALNFVAYGLPVCTRFCKIMWKLHFEHRPITAVPLLYFVAVQM
jgi:hypothetical protein